MEISSNFWEVRKIGAQGELQVLTGEGKLSVGLIWFKLSGISKYRGLTLEKSGFYCNEHADFSSSGFGIFVKQSLLRVISYCIIDWCQVPLL